MILVGTLMLKMLSKM